MGLPATLDVVAAVIEEVLAAGGALTEDELVGALRERGVDLGVDPAETVADALDDDDLPLVLPLGDGRHALLPALLAGRTFTHRVSAVEVEHGFLNVAPDLEPVSILTEDERYHRLVDGSPVTEVLPGFDDELLAERGIPVEAISEAALVLEPDAFMRLGVAAGDLVGLTVRSEGFELTAVPAVESAPELAGRLADALERLAEGGPEQIDSVAWLACAEDPALFRTPLRPLVEVFAEAGLVWEGEQVGPAGFDFALWRVQQRVERVAELHRLGEDEALAVLALARMYEQVSEVFDRAQEAVDAGRPLTEALPDVVDHPGDGHRGNGGEPAVGSTGAGTDGAVAGERRLVRATLESLVDPAVAGAVLVETIGAGRDGAAALGLFAESLESQAPRTARPALRWLRGKALERLGNVEDAERAFEAALAIDAGWPLALFEVARYASDRGDAERGLSLLRRAGAPGDDELVVLLQHFRPVERKDLGRNQPCWCGSGRKYKACHRNREQLPLTERAAWLYQKAGLYLADGPWRSEVLAVARVRSAHWDRPLASYEATQDPLVCDAVLFEGGAFAQFVEERGVLLPEDERLLAQQWLLAERSVFEVETVRVGAGFTARDVRTGDRVEVRERQGSRTLKRGMLICTRIVPAGDTMQCFGGIEPVGLHERDDLIRLLDDEPDPVELVGLLSRRFAPPVLLTTEGEPSVLCEARLHTPDPVTLVAALDDAYDRDDDGEGDGARRWFEHVTTYGVDRIRATLTLAGEQVTVETNSEPRLERVLNLLRDRQPELQIVEQTRRPVADLAEAMSRAPAGTVPLDTLDPNEHPEIAAALDQLTRQHEKAWLDEQIPALAGATPREAAADPTRRPDLIRLLDSFPPGVTGAMDPDRLRAALGL